MGEGIQRSATSLKGVNPSAALDAWMEGKPDMGTKVEALQAPPALAMIRRLTVRRTVGE